MIIILCLIIGVIFINYLFDNIEIRNKNKVKYLILFVYCSILIVGGIVYYLEEREYKKKNKDFNFYIFLNKDKKNKDFFKQISIGIGSGIIFGMIDNMSLWFGMEALDDLFPGGTLTKAAYGNTFADTYGTIMSTFSSVIISRILITPPDIPLWSQATGVMIGCLLGLHISKLITGRQ